MAAASPAPLPTTAAGAATTGLDRFIQRTLGLAKSWVGLLTAYIGIVTAAIIAFQKLPEPLKSAPLWLRVTLLAAPLVFALAFQAIPELIDRRRRKRLTEITGHLQAGYFQLAPRENEATFTRADGKHEEILRWLEQRNSPILYLTGLSGSGKSSLLSAWVLPRLERKDTAVIRLRGYQDPIAAPERELLRPGVIWQKPTAEAGGARGLLERACRYLRPRRLLVVLDQFEEFVILQEADQQQRFEQLMSSLRQQPIADLTFLFVFRSDYIGLIEKLALPPLNQNTNWQEVPPFTESAARDFVQASGLQVSDDILRDVLREAAEIEQTRGIIRPVTINLCGLVLGRFATGLPHGFRPGGLIRGFLRESVLLPPIRDIAPVLVPHLITGYVTKRPRTVAELATDAGSDPAAVRGCLRMLGQSERAIVRPLDKEQQTWEISHDFLVPLLDSIVGRWRMPFRRRLRSWLPWIAATAMVAALVVAANWRSDPVAGLTKLGWTVHQTDKGLELHFEGGPPPKESLKLLRRTSQPLTVRISDCDNIKSLSGWAVLKNLTELDLTGWIIPDLFPSPLTDVSPLKELKSLATLDLNFTKVSDVSPLKGLTNLTTLNLMNTKVSDVAPLKELTNLTTLNLNGTQVSDVSPLKGLKNLNKLFLEGTKVSDASPLKELTNLSSLNLDGTQVSDVSPLQELTNLKHLELGGTKASEVSPLERLTNLTELNLGDTKVSDVSPLRDLRKLKELNLRGTKVSDASPLKELTDVAKLGLAGTEVSDVSPLQRLKDLKELFLDGSKVSNVSPLKELTNLTLLELRDTKVKDVSPLGALTNLTTLDLRGTEVSNVSPLKGLKSLKELYLGGTKVRNVSPLRDLTNLTTLGLSSTNVSDVSALKGLTNLTKLDLRWSKVKDVSPLKGIKGLQILGP